jgi:glycosyltransferase involved in cell wall biosynthesis
MPAAQAQRRTKSSSSFHSIVAHRRVIEACYHLASFDLFGRGPVHNIVISIVIPVFNSGEAMVRECHAALAAVLATLSEPAEIIFVDDGSRDDTLAALKAVQRIDTRIRILELTANFGQHAAFSAGFDAVRGDVVVTMDVDLQADPAEIPRMIAPLRNGFDLVSGVRLHRRDPIMRRLASAVVTRLVATMTGVRLRDIGCPFNAFTADVAKSLSSFGELRRFLKPLAVRVARSVIEVEVSHRARPAHHVRTSYSSTRLLRLFMDFFVNSVTDMFAWVFVGGAAVAAAGVVALLVLGGFWLAGSVGGRALALDAVAVAAAALVALLGLIGDYAQRIYRQGSGRPFYLVRRVDDAPDVVPQSRVG